MNAMWGFVATVRNPFFSALLREGALPLAKRVTLLSITVTPNESGTETMAAAAVPKASLYDKDLSGGTPWVNRRFRTVVFLSWGFMAFAIEVYLEEESSDEIFNEHYLIPILNVIFTVASNINIF